MTTPFTAILLAGGKSSRMGCDKATLQLNKVSLLEWQVEKMRTLGADEILISGPRREELPDLNFVPDQYPNCGPLAGLHACLKVASNSHCLVMSIDTPLVSLQSLRQLLAAHNGGITVLRHNGYAEPLIGVYDRALAETIEPLLKTGGAPVRMLQQLCPWNYLEFSEPVELLCNCNTPDEFAELQTIVRHYM